MSAVVQAPVTADDRILERIRWRARRGLLENDILLGRFLDAELTQLTAAELRVLDELLRLGDNDLLDLLMGRTESAEPGQASMIARLRSA